MSQNVTNVSRYTAFGVPKVSHEHSLFHSVFNYTLREEMWLEYLNTTEQSSFTNATIDYGQLNVASNGVGNATTLISKRCSRYQPNRGIHYAASIGLPSKTNDGLRDFGAFNDESGYFFRLKSDGELYACVRSTTGGGTVTTEKIISLPKGFENFDIEKNNIYDIQVQFRGVGSVNYYIGSPEDDELRLVSRHDLLGTLTHLNCNNPSLSLCYRSENITQDVTILSGCCDLSSEGGMATDLLLYESVSTSTLSGSVAITGYNQPLLALKIPSTLSGLINTRNVIMHTLTVYGDQKGIGRMWRTRDATALVLSGAFAAVSDGSVEFIENGDITSFDTAKASLIWGNRFPQDGSASFDQLDSHVLFFGGAGDYLVVTAHRETGGAANCGCSISYLLEV